MSKNAPPTDQLHYDPYERRSGLVRFLALDTDAEAWASARAIELGDAVAGAFEIEHLELDRLIASRLGTVTGEAGPAEVRVVKELVLGGDRRTPTLDLTATVEPLAGTRGGAVRPGMDVDDARRRRQSISLVGGRWLEDDA